MVIIQAITTHWTKASRGAPHAAARAAVPEAAALPAGGRPSDGVFVHELEAVEATGFVLDDITADSRRDLPVTVAGVKVEIDDDHKDQVVVTRLANRWGGWPPRERERVVFRLAAGESGRAIRNARIGGARQWTYSRTVVNVAHLDGDDLGGGDLFVATSPTHLVNEEASLR